MAPRGLVITANQTGPTHPEVIESLARVGLTPSPLEDVADRSIDVLVWIDEDGSSEDVMLPAAKERHLLKTAMPSSPEELTATRERLREHLRRLMARRLDQPADPEASAGWLREIDRQR